MKYQFRDLVDLDALGELLDGLYEVARVPSVIVDVEGKILTGAGWQRICSEFHRRHPEAEKICIASDLRLARELEGGAPYSISKCPHGLVDSSCPIIIEGEQVGSVFTGQMLHAPLDDEVRERFRRQAKDYGFDEAEYLAALEEVPVCPVAKHEAILGLISKLAGQIAQMGLSNLRVLEAAQRAEEAENRFRLLMDSLDAVVYVADMESHEVLFINQYGKDLLGEITGKICWQSIQVGQSGPCEFCTNEFLLDDDGHPAGAHTWEFQNTVTNQWLHIHDRAIHWPDGRLVRMEIATDITEGKLAREKNAALEARLQQARKMEALGTLAGGVAHDFNNILMGVLGNAELSLLDMPPESPIRSNVQDIVAGTVRAADLAKQMLAYSGRGRFVVEPVDLDRMVVETAHLLRATISKAAILNLEPSKNVASIQADVTQVRQVLMNLVTNALEALGDETGVITVSTGVMEVTEDRLEGVFVHDSVELGNYAYMEVSDTGCGMDKETEERIFDPFFTTKFTGRGLGLAATLGIVRGHKGAIKVSSEPGAGTVIRVLFPCSDQALADERAPWQGEGTILVVDDEETVRSIAKKTLLRHGFEVLVAGDGREGLEVLGEHLEATRLVLLDVTMPHMGGKETFSEMRKVRPDLLVVLSSGYNELETITEFAGEGLAGFLQKPYRPAELIKTVRGLLDPETS